MDADSLVIRSPELRDAAVAALLLAQSAASGGADPTTTLPGPAVFLALTDAGLREPWPKVEARLRAANLIVSPSTGAGGDGDGNVGEPQVTVAALVAALTPRSGDDATSFRAPPSMKLLGYGEAMIRLAPVARGDTDDIYGRGKPSGNATYLRSIGGDEMNVCVAHAMLGNEAEWVSVLPSGPNGEYVANCCRDLGMPVDHLRFVEGADMGVFWVLPTEKRVLYQRKFSAFWIDQTEADFDWAAVFAPVEGLTKWLHATGITPLCGEVAAKVWVTHIEEAVRHGVQVSIDLNHRPALAPFPALWDIAKDVVRLAHTLILARDSVVNLLTVLDGDAGDLSLAVPEDDARWTKALQRIREAVPGPNIACCFKKANRDPATGEPVKSDAGYTEQTRWSVIVPADGSEAVSSAATPVIHAPCEPCGGGSCWAAGFIDAQVAGLSLGLSMRRADVLAAMAQETMGDHSQVTRAMLQNVEARYKGEPAVVALNADGSYVV